MDLYDEAMKSLDSNEMGRFYDRNKTKSAIRDIYFNGRQARFSGDINEDKIQEVLDDPSNFNISSITKEFMKDLPVRVTEKYTKMWDQYGEKYDIQENKTKLGFQYETDPATGEQKVILDPRTGYPKISLTDEVYLQAMDDPFLSKVVNKYVPDGDINKQRQVLTSLLEGLDPSSTQNRVQVGHKYPERDVRYNAYGRGFSTPIADLQDREDRYQKIVGPERRADLLTSLNNTDSEEKAFYGDANGKIVADPKKAKTIVLAYLGQPEPANMKEFEDKDGKLNIVKWAMSEKSRGKIIKKEAFPIDTEEGQRKAKIALSLRQDQIDPKRSIGEEFANFIEAKYQHQQKNKAKGKSIADQMKAAINQ